MFSLLKVNVMLALLKSFINSLSKSAKNLGTKLTAMHKEEDVLYQKDNDKATQASKSTCVETDKEQQQIREQIATLKEKIQDCTKLLLRLKRKQNAAQKNVKL